MSEEKDQNGGAWSKVPTWDGSPQTWRSFQREMMWWQSALDLESTKKYNLAARWLLRQSGVVRQRGEEFTPDELAYQKEVRGPDPVDGQGEIVITPEDPLSGVKKLMKALEGINGRTTLDKRGELRNLFYIDLKRRGGERISEFSTRFRTMLADLRAEGVTLPPGEIGWFYKQKLGLDSLRLQLLETALAGAEGYEETEREVLRLFKDLHFQDPLMRKTGMADTGQRSPLLNRFLNQTATGSRPPSYAPSTASSAQRTFRSSASSATSQRSVQPFRKFAPGQKHVMVSEAEDPEVADDPQDEADGDDDAGGQDLEEVLKCEAEALAAELDDAAELGIDPDTLAEVENTVETAAEALVTMKEARTKLAEVRRDRGYGRTALANGKRKDHQSKKQKSNCFDCGLAGHWAGDAECKKPGMKLGRKPKQVQIAETMNTEHQVDETAVEDGAHEILTVAVRPLSHSLAVALEASHNKPKEVDVAVVGLTADKRLVGALDSACNRTCTGPDWLRGYLQCLRSAPSDVQNLVKSQTEHETFRFGNGGTKISLERWRLPTVIGGQVICFWVSLVDVPSLGLLLGRDFLEAVGADISFLRREMRCEHLDGHPIALKQLSAGHYLLPLVPSSWPAVGDHRWRKLGPDQVVELQMSAKQWLSQFFRLKGSQAHEVSPHDHMLTEKSLQVGNLVCTVMTTGTSMRMAQAPTMRSPSLKLAPTSTSSPTRKSSSPSRSSALTVKSDGRTASAKASGKMAPIRYAPQGKGSLGRKGRSSVGFAKAFLALAALAVSSHGLSGKMDHTMQEPSAGQGVPRKALPEGTGPEPVHHGQLGRMCAPSQSPWTSDGVLRGPNVGRYAGRDGSQGALQAPEECCSGGSAGSRSEGRVFGQERTRGPNFDWTKRRVANLEKRPPEAGCLAARGGGRKGHCGQHQDQGPSDGGNPEEQATASCGSQISSQAERGHSQKCSSRCERLINVCRKQASDPDHRPPSRDVGSDAKNGARTSATTRHGSYRSSANFRRPDGHGCEIRANGDGADGGRDASCSRGLCGGKIGKEIWNQRSSTAEDGGNRDQRRRLEPGLINEFTINQTVKKGQAQMIAQAWNRHETERLRTSWGPRKIHQALIADFEDEMKSFVTDEIFIQPLNLAHSSYALGDSNEVLENAQVSKNVLMPENAKASKNVQLPENAKVSKNVLVPDDAELPKNDLKPFLTEVFTTSQNVTKEAVRRGHQVGDPLSLDTGWNFLIPSHREAALKKIREEKPYCVVLAFPCGPFSPLQRFNQTHPERHAVRLQEGRVLMDFAIEVAELQMRGGRHCILENPKPSGAWSEPAMQKFLEEFEIYVSNFDQCRFNLRNIEGFLHKKPTRIATSSSKVNLELEGHVCRRDHFHAPVLGGSKVTARAGIYPKPLARALVRGLERQFDSGFAVREVFAVDGADDDAEEELAFEGAGFLNPQGNEDGSDVDEPDEKDGKTVAIPAGVRAAVLRLHQNTGHRSGKRLVRALAIAGAPSEAILAAKQLKCAVCQEQRPPRARRPASLPLPKDMGDQLHVDLIEVEDVRETRFYLAHGTDFATRFQLAEVLPDKSTKSVIKFLDRWLAVFGPPRVMVADQGREFVSWEMEEWASAHSVLLHHIAVQAPWQNGVAERSGGILKTILSAVIASQGVCGAEEMQSALSESVAAYNGDINELGTSPYQAAGGNPNTSFRTRPSGIKTFFG